ncbi:MAG: histidinol-phosphate transaminase [Butyricicoccus sp.]
MITLPEKLSSMTPYDPSENVYRIKLDANESFFELPLELKDEIATGIMSVDFNRYPDPSVSAVRVLAGREFGVAAQNIVVGNGSDELLSVITNTFVPRGGKVMVVLPDFSMYQFYAEVSEFEVVSALKDDEFELDCEELIARAKEEKPSMLIFSNPCNPCGKGFTHAETLKICNALEDTLVVVDEAYMDFWDQSILDVSCMFENVLVLKTLSKAYGCAALRMGFAIGDKELIDQLNKTRSPYNVNSLSQMAAICVLEDTTWAKEQTAEIIERKNELESAMRELEEKYGVFRVQPSHTNFVVIRTEKANELYEALLDCSICVRCFAKHNMLRITTGDDMENSVLIEEMERILKEGV